MTETTELLARADAVGQELIEIGVALFHAGEVHEARHILAALLAGNTSECTNDCPLHTGTPKLTITVEHPQEGEARLRAVAPLPAGDAS